MLYIGLSKDDNKKIIGELQQGIGNFSGKMYVNNIEIQDGSLERLINNCPFCGKEPELITRGNDFTKKRSAEVKCKNCNVIMSVGAIYNNLEWAKNIVVDKWNERVL